MEHIEREQMSLPGDRGSATTHHTFSVEPAAGGGAAVTHRAPCADPLPGHGRAGGPDA